jgi:hypothetical protein
MSWRRVALPALLTLVWACGGDGGPADPGDSVNIEDNWAFVESFANAAQTVTCRNEGTFAFDQTNATFAGQGYQTGECQTPTGTLDNTGNGEITAGQVSSSVVTFTYGGCEYRGTLLGSPIDSLTGTLVCWTTIGNGIVRLDGTWTALKGELNPPTVSATLQPPEGDYIFVPQDQFRLALTAEDDRKLRWVGYRLGPPASVQDSVAVSQKTFDGSLELPIQPSWVGESPLTLFARDDFGRLTETLAEQPLKVYDLVRRPLHTLTLPATVSDIVPDAKRGKLYLVEYLEGHAQVLRLSDYGFDSPIPFPTALPGGSAVGADLTASGDSLVFAVTDPPVLHFVNLITGATSDETIVQSGAQSVNLLDVNVAAGRAFVYGSFQASDFSVAYTLWEFNLATKAQQRRLDAGDVGGNLGNIEYTASPDRSRLLLINSGEFACMQLYTQATGFGSCVVPPARDDNVPSGSRNGSAWLVRNLLYDGALNVIGTPAAEGSPAGAITPDADLAYYPTAMGYDVVEVPSGVVREHVRIPYPLPPSRFTLVPDLGRLVVWHGDTHNTDRITIVELE